MKGKIISDEEYNKSYKIAFSFVDELAASHKQIEIKKPEKKKEKDRENT